MLDILRKKPIPWQNLGPDRPDRGPNSPPDLEEVFEKMLQKFKLIKDKKRPSPFGGNGSGGGGSGRSMRFDIRHVIGLIVVVWAVSGFFIVDEREESVVLQFGKYKETLYPGLHWIPLGIETQETIDMKTIRSVTSRATLLTGDENIISLEYDIQFVISDIKSYLFNVRDQEKTVRDVVESAVREIVGVNKMDYLLTEGRSFIGGKSSELGQKILDEYMIGITLQTVNLISAQPPDPVQSAFSDANKAREDEQRYINEAEVYRNEILPKARGQSRQMLEEAKAYRFKVIESAKGETERFKKIYAEYVKAPAITRERIYLETMETIMQRSNKVFIDAKNSKPILYIPSQGGNRQNAEPFNPKDQGAILGPAANDLLNR